MLIPQGTKAIPLDVLGLSGTPSRSPIGLFLILINKTKPAGLLEPFPSGPPSPL